MSILAPVSSTFEQIYSPEKKPHTKYYKMCSKGKSTKPNQRDVTSKFI